MISRLSSDSTRSMSSSSARTPGKDPSRSSSGKKKNFFQKLFKKTSSGQSLKGMNEKAEGDDVLEEREMASSDSDEGSARSSFSQKEAPTAEPESKGEEEPDERESLTRGEIAQVLLKEKVEGFQVSTTGLVQKLENAMSQRTSLAVEASGLEAEHRELNLELHEAESRQAAFAEAEEFEQADKLTSAVANLRNKADNVSERLGAVRAKLLRSEALTDQLKTEQKIELQLLVQRMELFCKDQDKALRSMIIEAQKVLEGESRRLTKEEDRLKMQREYIEKDENHLQEETKQTESAIAEQTQGIEQTRQSLGKAHIKLKGEIEHLEQMLADKKSALESVEEELETATDEIAEIRTKFSRQLSRIEERKNMLNQTKAECDNEENQLDQSKKEYEAKTRAIQHDQGQIQSVVDNAKLHIKLARFVEGILQEQEEWAEKLEDQLPEQDGSFDELQEQVQALREETNVFKEQQSKLEAQMLSSKSQVDEISLELPKLEHAKKTAAAARNYKEAGAKSKEIKSLQEKQIHTLEELEVIEQTLSHCKSEYTTKAEVLLAKEAELYQMELNMQLLKFQALKENVIHLKKMKQRILKDKPCDFQESALQILEMEIQSRYALGREICATNKLNGDEFNLELLEFEEEEEEEEEVELQEEKEEEKPLQIQSENESPSTVNEEDSVKEQNISLTPQDDTGEEAEEASDPADAGSSSVSIEAIDTQVLEAGLEIQKTVLELEAKIESAVEEEDYDQAAVLDEQLEQLKQQLEELGLSEEQVLSYQDKMKDADGLEYSEEPLQEESCTNSSDGAGIHSVDDHCQSEEVDVGAESYSALGKEPLCEPPVRTSEEHVPSQDKGQMVELETSYTDDENIIKSLDEQKTHLEVSEMAESSVEREGSTPEGSPIELEPQKADLCPEDSQSEGSSVEEKEGNSSTTKSFVENLESESPDPTTETSDAESSTVPKNNKEDSALEDAPKEGEAEGNLLKECEAMLEQLEEEDALES